MGSLRDFLPFASFFKIPVHYVECGTLSTKIRVCLRAQSNLPRKNTIPGRVCSGLHSIRKECAKVFSCLRFCVLVPEIIQKDFCHCISRCVSSTQLCRGMQFKTFNRITYDEKLLMNLPLRTVIYQNEATLIRVLQYFSPVAFNNADAWLRIHG